MKLWNEGKALLPTKASASMVRCSNLTSISGTSTPTLKKGRDMKTHYQKVKGRCWMLGCGEMWETPMRHISGKIFNVQKQLARNAREEEKSDRKSVV